MKLDLLNTLYTEVKTPELHGRYITNSHIEPCLDKLLKPIKKTLGYSVENRPIYSLTYGHGAIKVLLWSQMHGNESTSTKALFDCFNLFESDNKTAKRLLEHCTLVVIPILNPDGAERYTRLNANLVDLNRDAQDLTQPESEILRQAYYIEKPDYCFNLHGQRTLFSAGETNHVATLSFLSPAQDSERTLTANRKAAMVIIAEINRLLQDEIPNGIGRYDDGFNLNCVGDTFQNFGVPTLLYEAGHYANDYDREEVRRLMFIAILKGLDVLIDNVEPENYKSYFSIPENGKLFNDIIIRNVKRSDMGELVDVAIQYKEVLISSELRFVPVVDAITELSPKFGHKEIDANGSTVTTLDHSDLILGSEIVFVMIDNEEISLKP
ncbi:M14 family zinc carboxypeptidase [Winogradskyella wichelsiae]|uniref:M14 family zinc carboxypeptidase n=1 Tax=Winogradskyella wichelsiae TaxID=2697007 RepID=UPI003EFAECB8